MIQAVTQQELDSFWQLAKEVEIKLPRGESVWLVPSRTDQNRCEITRAELEQISRVTELFPGSKVTSFTPNRELAAVDPGSFKNEHLSVSRAQKWEQCPNKFALSYIYKVERESGGEADFGKIEHNTLERLVNEHCDDESDGPLDAERAEVIFKQEWAKKSLTGLELFELGLELVRRFVVGFGPLDSWDVLAVEERFELEVGDYKVVGALDLVLKVDDETIEIIDYKTNKRLFSRYALERELQLGVYKAAARRLWPWAKRIKLTYYMLRHGIRQSVERTDEQAEAALEYLATVGAQTEQATDYPARLGPLCGWCGVRGSCLAYQRALTDKAEVATELPEVLEDVCQEWSTTDARIRVLERRRRELEGFIRPHLKGGEAVEAGGTRFALFRTTTLTYPRIDMLEVFDQFDVDLDEVVEAVEVVDPKRLEDFVDELELPRSKKALLKVELEAIAATTFGYRFYSTQLKERSLNA